MVSHDRLQPDVTTFCKKKKNASLFFKMSNRVPGGRELTTGFSEKYATISLTKQKYITGIILMSSESNYV